VEFAADLARVGLAVMFATAAWTKLLDRAGFRQSVIELGGPAALAPAVPVIELVVAAGLLLEPLARASAMGALVVLGVFTAAIARALAQGRRPTCNCFGQLSAAPIGAASLVRNLAFVAVALFVALS
jgi:uncharacterized membrane protein YphA (DoxX/SURF4 family)